MEPNRKLLSIIFSIIVIGIITAPVYAATIIETEKPVDVKKELLAETLSDLRNYKELFPDLVKSVELKQDPNYAKFTIVAQGTTYVADVKSSIQPDGSFVIDILSGGIKGTKMITTLSERYSFDGKIPNGATTVKTKLILETDFWTSIALMFVGTGEIRKAVGDGFYNIGEYVKVKYSQDTINTTPRLEAAKTLEPSKEEKPQLTTSLQNQQTKPKTNLQDIFEKNDTKSQIQINPYIFAKTAKASYSNGEQIIVFGTVNKIQKDVAVSILIIRPDGKTVAVSQTDVSQSGRFVETIKADGPLFSMSGIYTVSIKYGILGYKTTFEFTNKVTDLQANAEQDDTLSRNLTIDVDAPLGATTITVSGHTDRVNTPVTISVKSPNENFVDTAQVTPDSNGDFMVKLQTNSPLWRQDGSYTITAYHADLSNHNTTVQVKIVDGAVASYGVGTLGDEHEHASILVRIHGDKFDFSLPAYQIKSSWIHFEGQDGNTIHRHASGVTLGNLFDTLGMKLTSECFIFPDDRQFCGGFEYSLKFYINHKKVTDIRNYVIQDDNRILISYGNETPEHIKQQLLELDSQVIIK